MFSIAVSSNDEFVALGSAAEVFIYRVDSQRLFRHQVSSVPSNRLPNQRISFSAEGGKFIVATRNGEGNVRIYVNDCMGDTTTCDVAALKIPTVGRFFSTRIPSYFPSTLRPVPERRNFIG